MMRLLALAALLAGSWSPLMQAEDAPACNESVGQEVYFPCSSCHGQSGSGNEAFGAPALAGLAGDYLAAQLRAFRLGRRGTHPEDASGRQMAFLAGSLRDEQDIAAVSCYLAGLAPARRPQVVTGNVTAGAVHYAGCVACHGSQGEGSRILGAPALNLTQDWYQLAQLNAYRAGWRGGPGADAASIQMRAAANALPDERAVRDVVAYIATLPGRMSPQDDVDEGFSVVKDAIP